MKDFTLDAYRQYLDAIKASYQNILRFSDFFSMPEPPASFIIIRHDVDRKPKNALKMARLESETGISSTYYFRTRPNVFRPEIISEIAGAGHEIGYHYESLSDAKGDQQAAIKDFEQNLEKLRSLVPVSTIAMHGSPLSPHDNRDLWQIRENRQYFKNTLEISGEVYLDIDYSDIAYITDTGRNWNSSKANRRDTVNSAIKPDIKSKSELLDCFKKALYPRIVFQVHPERWTDSRIEYFIQFGKDSLANFIKAIVK